jgi:hypothetical protein
MRLKTLRHIFSALTAAFYFKLPAELTKRDKPLGILSFYLRKAVAVGAKNKLLYFSHTLFHELGGR